MKKFLVVMSYLTLVSSLWAADFSLNPARDFGAIRRINPTDYDGKSVVREDGTGLSSDTAAAFRAALEVFSKAEAEPAGAVAAHAALVSAHGATGAVVGTSNTQSLTNKTLTDASNHISGAVIDTGVVADANIASTIARDSEYIAADSAVLSAANASDALLLRLDGSRAMTGNLRLGGKWLSNDGGDEGVYVAADGKVGIGTAEPAAKLSVKGQGNTSCLEIQRTGSSEAQFRIVTAEEGGYTALSSMVSPRWTNVIESSNSSLMLTTYELAGTGGKIILDGNVLIGTTTDDVSSKVQVKGKITTFRSDGTTSASFSGEYGHCTIDSSNGNFSFIRGGSYSDTTMFLHDSGNVIIGATTNDGTNKLQVNGSVAISSFMQLASPTAIPTAAPGRIYFNGTESKFKKCLTGTTWVDM